MLCVKAWGAACSPGFLFWGGGICYELLDHLSMHACNKHALVIQSSQGQHYGRHLNYSASTPVTFASWRLWRLARAWVNSAPVSTIMAL